MLQEMSGKDTLGLCELSCNFTAKEQHGMCDLAWHIIARLSHGMCGLAWQGLAREWYEYGIVSVIYRDML